MKATECEDAKEFRINGERSWGKQREREKKKNNPAEGGVTEDLIERKL